MQMESYPRVPPSVSSLLPVCHLPPHKVSTSHPVRRVILLGVPLLASRGTGSMIGRLCLPGRSSQLVTGASHHNLVAHRGDLHRLEISFFFFPTLMLPLLRGINSAADGEEDGEPVLYRLAGHARSTSATLVGTSKFDLTTPQRSPPEKDHARLSLRRKGLAWSHYEPCLH